MSKTMKKLLKRRGEPTFGLQITSMVDMFTILLVFLLKSYSSSAVNITPADGVKLPNSTTQSEAQEVLKLTVSKKGVFVDDVQVVAIVDGKFEANDLEASDDLFIRKLYETLDKQAEKARGIASVNESMKFDGRVLVQADESLDYGTLKKVMYTSMLAGYADVKLAVVSME